MELLVLENGKGDPAKLPGLDWAWNFNGKTGPAGLWCLLLTRVGLGCTLPNH